MRVKEKKKEENEKDGSDGKQWNKEKGECESDADEEKWEKEKLEPSHYFPKVKFKKKQGN